MRQSFYFIFLLIGLSLLHEAEAQPSFLKMGPEVAILGSYSSLPYDAGGVSFKDFDNDGWDDLTLCTGIGQPIRFFKNRFGQFEEIFMIQTNLGAHYYSVWIDYDNDNDLDFFSLSDLSGAQLFENNGAFVFTDITANSGFDSLSGSPLRGATFGDFNNDGLVDVYICSYSLISGNNMFFQTPNNTFENVTVLSGTADSLRYSFMGIVLDYNNDGWMDFYVANDGNTSKNSMYKNNGDSTFSDVSVQTGTDLLLDAMGMSLGDYDGDLDLDIHITDKLDSKVLRLNSNSTYSEVGTQVGLDHPSGFGWGTNFFDADLDGDEDLYISTNYVSLSSAPSVLCVNNGQGMFTETFIGSDSGFSFTNVLGDYNNDRLLDIAVLNSDGQQSNIWQNTLVNPESRFSFKLEGCGNIHKDAAGAIIKVFDGGDSRVFPYHISESYVGQNSDKKVTPILNGVNLDSMIVEWSNGNSSVLYNIQPNQTLVISECEAAKPLPVILVPNYATQGLVSCSGDSILLELDGNYDSVIWSTGETTNSINVTAAGEYDVTVTNQFGVSASSVSVEVLSYETPQYTIITETPDCFNDGWVQIEPIDSNTTYSYQWSNGSTSNFVSNLNVGSYEVTISADGECEQVETITINQPQNSTPLGISATSTDLTCFEDNSGSIEVSVSGGTPPYVYSWTNQCTTSLNDSIESGSYGITITDDISCEADTSISLNQPDQILAYIDVTPDTNSIGLGMISLTVIGGTPPYAISWNDSLSQIGTMASNLINGSYQASISDLNNCSRTLEITVPNIEITGINEFKSSDGSITCFHQEEKVILSLNTKNQATNLSSISLFDLQGRRVSCSKTLIGESTVLLDFEDQGVFIIRDDASSQTCKVVKL